MFELICADAELKKKLRNPEEFYPPEVCQELDFILSSLRKHGQLARTDFYDINTHRISANTFYFFYRPQVVKGGLEGNRKEVLIIDLKMKTADVFKQRFQISDDWDDQDVLYSLPQYDKPSKIIKAVELIHQGMTDSYQLGDSLGHCGKKEKYVARHGDYAKQTLDQLKLITRIREGKSFKVELTQRGRCIATAPNESLKNRLLIQAMLSYLPLWKIIVAVTPLGDNINAEKVLTDELVKELVFPEVLRSSNTSDRRSQTLKNWIKWISKESGIPVRLYDDGIQLPIPLIYAENTIE
ncbi:DUF7226 domain-containing protein [Vacuolonema iberomarrocanum]|uniref:DUF7226 domain-containing protein n=1 Tax=Vacuolonema iberomarrocanum TaxID=3454632 RepID=UPI0019D8573B|nr:hypothetical protein [filamentous cyanobacterium LEGE 07170]